jgi:hypothetical protein
VDDILVWPFVIDNAICKLCIEIPFGHHVLSVKPVVEQELGEKLMYWNIACLRNI